LEILEERVLPATVTWIGGSGDWSTVSNWRDDAMANRLPGPADDAVIDVAGISVTHSAGADTVKSLTINDPFSLSGGTLTVTGNLQMENGNVLSLSGGILADAAVGAGSTVQATAEGGILDGLTLGGTLDVTTAGAAVTITDGLTLQNGLIKAGYTASIDFSGTQTLGGTGTVQFTDDNSGGSFFVIPASLFTSPSTTLTIGGNVTITGTSGAIDDSDGGLVNEGTIQADTAGGSIQVGGTGDSWTNQGTIEVSNGATASLIGSWSNTGTISETNSTLNLGGSFKTSGLGTLQRSGGQVNITGMLMNDGTIALDDTSGSWNLSGGTISGGQITLTGSAVLVATPARGTLDGVTFAGTLDVTAANSAVIVTSGLTLQNGLLKIGYSDFVNFSGTQTLGGAGIVQFTDDNISGAFTHEGGVIEGSGTPFTLGPNITVTGTSGQITDHYSSFVNQGTVRMETPGDGIWIGGVSDSWTNQGTIEAFNGAALTLTGSWTNTGIIRENDSTLNLEGSFKTSGLGTITSALGEVNLVGTLTNDGTLALNDSTGSWILANGTINGGTISTSGDAKFIGGVSGGTLNGVTLAGTCVLYDAQRALAGRVLVTGGLTLQLGTIDLLAGSLISFQGTQTLGGNGEVDFTDKENVNTMLFSAGTTLTIGAGITIHGGGGTIEPDGSGAQLVNQGTIRVDGGGTLIVSGISNFTSGTLAGGTWQASGDSNLELVGVSVTSNAAAILLDGPNARITSDGTIPALAGLIDNATGASLAFQNGATFNTQAGLSNEGSLTVGTGSSLTVNGDVLSSGIATVNGTLTAGTFTVANGGTLNSSGTIAANLVNNGLVSPGSSPGILTVQGNYTQSNVGVLTVEIGGALPGNGFDQLLASGSATLDGALNIELVNGFGPAAGQTFQVMSLHGLTGAFATINGLTLDRKTLFTSSLSLSGLVLTSQFNAADLAFDHLTLPSNTLAPGQEVLIPYQVNNLNDATALGSWYDSFYLSTGGVLDQSAVLLGRVLHLDDLAGHSSYSATLDAFVPNVPDGNYRVIVLVDSRNQVPDINRANNSFVSTGALAVRVPALTLGTPFAETIAGGQDEYFRLDVGAGQDVVITADFTVTVQAQIYVRYGALPDQANFDQTANAVNQQPQIELSNPQGGAYYILVHGLEAAGAASGFTLEANAVQFSITSVSPNYGSSAGQATATISGTGFSQNTSVALVDAAGEVHAAEVSFKDEHTLFATFDLQGLITGAYTVRVADQSNLDSLADSFTVTAGKPGQLAVYLSVPAGIRPHQPDTRITIAYANLGDTDIPAPLLTVLAQNALLRLPEQSDFVGETMQVLAINEDGPAGILPPGYHNSLQLVFTPETFGTHVTSNFTVYLPAAADTVMDWNSLKDSSRPSYIPPDAWDAVWTNFTAAAGPTVDSYETLLAHDATVLSRLGIYTADPARLFAYELQKADAIPPVLTLSTALDAAFAAPGPGLDFSRSFQQPLDGRFRLGRLGRGWIDNFDVTISADSQGVVTLQEGGTIRLFSPQPDGSYVDTSGALGTLALESGVYQLREKDGTILAFRSDGQLDYLQDANGNRITAGYTNGLLTGLTHSDGDALILTYNLQGRISQITDPAGRVNAYSYDASGEHLISATYLAGTPSAQTTTYSYSADSSGPGAHELLSVTKPDGTEILFSYDAQGRLVGSQFAGGAQAITYSYEVNGSFTVRDALGNQGTFFFDDQGRVEQVVSPLDRTVSYQFDPAGNLNRVSLPGGGAVSAAFDAHNNPTRLVDPLGQVTGSTYDPANDALTQLRDPLGNTTNFQNDAAGNLLQIVEPDGNGPQYTYDSAGDLLSLTNERGQTIHFSYNKRGQLVRKDYPDGSYVALTYDSRGNLTSASQVNGSTTFTTTIDYNAADLPIKVTYPDGTFLEYGYDAAGRRIQMTDQDGFTVYYSYDATGRLAGVTSGAGQGTTIVNYTYNAAGQLIREDRGNGTYCIYAYDAAGELIHLVNFGPSPALGQDGPVLSRFDYTYDALGRVSRMDTLDGSTNYGYDADGQLTSVTLPDGRSISYQYDGAGNRVAVTDNGFQTDYTANTLNQYTSAGNSTFLYDADGNLISKTDGTGTTTYSYDAQNRLIDTSGPNGTWTYEYDGFGNRIAVTHNGQRSSYMVDITQPGTVFRESQGSGLVAHYVQGLGLASRVDAAGNAAFYNFDAQGSTAQLTGAGGAVLNSYRYLPFGESICATGTTPNPFTYVGRFGVMDGGAGMYLMSQRFYLPDEGRFSQPDPIGINGGTNLYEYGSDNPISFIDPSGEFGTVAVCVIAAGVTLVVGGALIAGGYTLGYDQGQQDASQHPLGNRGGPGPGHSGPGGGAGGGGGSGGGGGGGGGGSGGPFDPPPPTLDLPPQPPGPRKGPKKGPSKGPGKGPGRGPGKGPKRPPPPPPGPGGGAGGTTQRTPGDPNDITGPAGFGSAAFVAKDQTFSYTIQFENKPDATAPAQVVRVTEQLDANLDWSTFQLGSFAFGGQVFFVPAGRQTYGTRLDERNTLGIFVDVSAVFDPSTGVLNWTFTSIDPETLDVPGDFLVGFLPPDVNPPSGEALVSYSVQPKVSDTTGTAISAKATIIFDAGLPDQSSLDTAPLFNTIDAGAPTSSVNPLTASSPPIFTVNWSGQDDLGGSGVAGYTVFVSDNAGAYSPLVTNTSATSATFTGQDGHTYSFYSIATDNVGNVQTAPGPVQSTTVSGATSFTNRSAPVIIYGTGSTTVSGQLQAVGGEHVIPSGETVQVTLGGVTQNATLQSDDSFSTSFATNTLGVVVPPYTISFLYNGDGNFNPTSATSTLTVTPGPAGAITTDQPVFGWAAVSGANHYALTVRHGKKVVLMLKHMTGTAYALSPRQALTPGQTYTWTVTPLNARGKAIASSTSPLTFQLLPLGGPVTVSPTGSIATDQPTFTWTAVTGADHTPANHFTITVTDIAARQVLTIKNVTGTSYTLTSGQALTPGHNFTWSVTAVSSDGKSTVRSQGAGFFIAPLTAPTGLAFTSASETFSWQAVTDAGYYSLEVVQSGSGRVIVNTGHVASTTYTPTSKQARQLKPGHSYTWFVTAVSTNGKVSARSLHAKFSLSKANNVLLGDSGRPMLIAGRRNDTLRAGTVGSVVGTEGNTLTGAGRTFEPNLNALLALMAEWSRNGIDYAEHGKPAFNIAFDLGPEEVHGIRVNGAELRYTAAAGNLLLKEEDGKVKASVFFVAYTKNDVADPSKRPITFTFNGGPGSSSVWLHLGAFGPKRVLLTDKGEPTRPPYRLVDNDLTLLGQTDLVFIDPVSTGYSRAAPGQSTKQFHGVQEDIQAVGEFIRLYTTKFKRWQSPKFLAGESYGTTRAAGLASHLQDQLGMNLNGIVLVSSVLDFQTLRFDDGNDLPYILFLPSYTATAWYHKKLSEELQADRRRALEEVEKFALTDYAIALMKGDKLSEKESGRIAQSLAHYTGLSETFILRSNLRVPMHRFAKELLRGERRSLGRFDSRYAGVDRDAAGEAPDYDPSYAAVQGAYTATLNQYLRSELKYESDLPYEILTGRVQPWDFGKAKNRYLNMSASLRKAMTKNKDLRVLVANGYYDLATPYFATEYTFNHLGLDRSLAGHVTMTYYDAGHMMYVERESHRKLQGDLERFYREASP
jgi:RHS repeat-associated protein